MSTGRTQKNVWHALCQDELEQVCGGLTVAKKYDPIDEGNPSEGSATDGFEQEETDVVRVWAL